MILIGRMRDCFTILVGNKSMDHLIPQMMGGGGWILHLVFYRIPKNASTSLTKHLGSLNLIKKHEKRFHEIVDKRIYKDWFDPTHAKPNEAYKVFKNELASYFSFCVVRNPWDRIVSMYNFSSKEKLGSLYNLPNDMSFEQFCHLLSDRKDDSLFIGSHKQVEWTKGYFPPKVILRFENLQNEFAAMLKDYNIHHINPEIPRLNSTKHSHYKDYYTPETKKIIANVFEEDIDVLKYTFD